MNNFPKISVLIPVYNGGIFLRSLVKNLQAQTMTDFEVIFVDDFSTDDSMHFLQQKATEDSRLKVIPRNHKGGTAIKGFVYGLPYCKGDYLFLISQDDLMENDTLEKLYNRAIETDADIIVPNMIWFYDDNVDHGGLMYEDKQEITGKDAFLKSLNWEIHGFNLRKADLVKKIGMDDKYYNSCEYATRIHYYYANKVAFCNTNFFYRQNNVNAITKTTIKPFVYEVLLTNLRLIDFMITNKIKANDYLKGLFYTVKEDFRNYASKKLFDEFNNEEKTLAKNILKLARIEYLKHSIKTRKFKFIYYAISLFFVNLDFKEKCSNA